MVDNTADSGVVDVLGEGAIVFELAVNVILFFCNELVLTYLLLMCMIALLLLNRFLLMML